MAPPTTIANPFRLAATLAMADETFRRIRDFIYELTGIYFLDNKKYLLEGRLAKRLQLLGLNDFESYYQLVKFASGRDQELNNLYNAITINETFFFRNESQFDALERTLVPQIVAARRGETQRPIRVWSAASSSGEEAYTIAMVFLEKIKPMYPWLKMEVIGTDISPGVLEVARQGLYREYSVRNMPRQYLEKYFHADGTRYQLNASVKNLVRFDHLNLFDRPRMRLMSRFDIVFCANVLIYFDTKSKIQVISDLYDAMSPGAFLFIGYAESLHGISSAFKLVNFPKTVAYKKE